MKRETIRHPKTYELAARLGCDRPAALGYLTLLWDFCGEVAPAGDIGKWGDSAIAKACDWNGEPSAFVCALVESRWLDSVQTPSRLIVHDWSQHCEAWVKKKLARARLTFVSGQCPDSVRTTDTLSYPIQSNPNPSNPILSGEQLVELLDLPSTYDTPPLRTALARWIDYRAAKGEPLNAIEIDALLMQWKPADFPAAVQHSIANSYKGVYPPPGIKSGDVPRNPKPIKIKATK
jgi:hypothetical protein